MHIDCEVCGAESPARSIQCVKCTQLFAFLLKEDADWEPRDYSMWLYSQHFQIHRKTLVQGTASLPAGERLKHLVGCLYYQVHHGGIWQYLSNPCGAQAPRLLEALRFIGARKHAQALEACLSWFPAGTPPRDQAERNRIIDSIPDKAACALYERMSHLVCDTDSEEDLLVLLHQAIRNLELNGSARLALH